VEQYRVLGEVSQNPQLNLTIVGADQLESLGSDERCADTAPAFGANRNVLEVRIRGRNTTGRRHLLAPARVQTPALLIDEPRQGIDVRTLEFGELPNFQDQAGERVFVRQRLQRFGVRRAGGLRSLDGL